MEIRARDWREWRGMWAVGLKQQGWYQRDIARALGASEVSVSHWLAPGRAEGLEALLSQAAPGHPPRLSAAQKRLIPEFLWHGPEFYGFHGDVWTRARIGRVIEEEFGVRYHKDHVGRLMKELRWTPQVPITRAIQRDEDAIRRWREERWPELLPQARRERRTLVFVDESGPVITFVSAALGTRFATLPCRSKAGGSRTRWQSGSEPPSNP